MAYTFLTGLTAEEAFALFSMKVFYMYICVYTVYTYMMYVQSKHTSFLQTFLPMLRCMYGY